MSWLSKALSSAGRGVVSVGAGIGKGVSAGLRGVASGAHAVAKVGGKIPVIGGGVKGLFDITLSAPLQLTSDIARGQRVDKSVMRFAKANLGGAQAVGPYAQAIVSAVPGLGALPSAAIGGALALSQGRPITDALVAATKGLVPGGPLAQSAFSVAESAIRGKRLDATALAALPISDAQKRAVEAVVKGASALASGKRVDAAALDAASTALPPDLQRAVNTAVLVAHGANLQKAATKALVPAAMARLQANGAQLVKANPILGAGARLVNRNRKAFETATGLLHGKVTPIQLTATRKFFKGSDRKAFDLAVSAHIGLASPTRKFFKSSAKRVLRPVAPNVLAPTAKSKAAADKAAAANFGRAAAMGMNGRSLADKESMLRLVVKNPDAALGVKSAVKARSTLWQRLLAYLGISK